MISRFGLDNVVLKQVAAHYPAQPDIYCSYIQKGIILTAGIGAIVVVLMWMFSEIIASNIFQEQRLSDHGADYLQHLITTAQLSCCID